ncbi:hypothetical protein F4777DRAFT_583403 [Nemania sp. FL0916]|nr:hypothetical protein F4777DRAFT_583403 [Nemania sp. FL0916]
MNGKDDLFDFEEECKRLVNQLTQPTTATKLSKRAQYRVENWQIPVPIGDASAHFLLRISNGDDEQISDDQTQLPRVVSAFFMDGGDDKYNETAAKMIIRALEAIDRAYTDQWKFDAIVTTHHDQDHYKGLKDLLEHSAPTLRGAAANLPFRQVYFKDNVTFYSGGEELIFDPRKYGITLQHDPIVGGHGIGIDIFSRTRMFQRFEGVSFHDEDAKCGVHSAAPISESERGRPRFVIVGAGGYGVHSSSASQITKNPSKNETSILALVYWPESGRTSYFTGGDGNPDVEIHGIVPWMRDMATKADRLPKLPVKMIKLDHHGSLGETLTSRHIHDFRENILETMQPTRVLVTPGHKHGHPNWAVLHLVQAYFLRQRKIGATAELYTTRSPYWMSKLKASGLDVNANHAAQDKVKAIMEIIAEEEDFPKAEELDFELPDDDTYLKYYDVLNRHRESYAGDNARKKEEDKKYREANLHLLDGVQKAQQPKKKYTTDPIIKERNKEDKKTTKDLKIAFKTGGEEPERTDRQDFDLIVKENRMEIIDQARSIWSTICEQEICDRGDPYWLVRFSFEDDNGPPAIDAWLDPDGYPAIVDIEEPEIRLQRSTDKSARALVYDLFEQKGTDSKKGEEPSFDAQGAETPVQALSYLFARIYQTEEKAGDRSFAYYNPGSKVNGDVPEEEEKSQEVNNHNTPVRLTNKSPYLEKTDMTVLTINKPTGRNKIPTMADFTDRKITDPGTGITQPFTQDRGEQLHFLLSFPAFLRKYAGIEYDDLPNVRGRPPKDGKGTRRKTESRRVLRMREQWNELVAHQLETTHEEFLGLERGKGKTSATVKSLPYIPETADTTAVGLLEKKKARKALSAEDLSQGIPAGRGPTEQNNPESTIKRDASKSGDKALQKEEKEAYSAGKKNVKNITIKDN